jgi:hypothetical protein
MAAEIRAFSMINHHLRDSPLRTAMSKHRTLEMGPKLGDDGDLKARYALFATAFVAGCATLWWSLVSDTVTEPYLVSPFP